MLMLRYPSRLGNLFIVNSGLVVYYLWQAISLLLSPVRITGHQTVLRHQHASVSRLSAA